MRKQTALVYAIGHFLVDFSCAYLLISQQPEAWLFVAYNFCAFALQMPIGLLSDMSGRSRSYAQIGVFLVAVALLPLPIVLRVILAGLGNACYHVGGGREALLESSQLTGLGLFVSPGAVGICLGTLWADLDFLRWVNIAVLLVLGILIHFLCTNEKKIITPGKPQLSSAALMFVVVILRSVVGMCMENPWKAGIFVVCSAVAAAAGKFLGGYIADRFGIKPTGVVSLLIAAILFCFPNNALAGILGCLLFNMTMPITLKNAAQALPGNEGFSFGILTFALFLGYLPAAQGVTFSSYFGAALALISALLLLLHRGKRHD